MLFVSVQSRIAVEIFSSNTVSINIFLIILITAVHLFCVWDNVEVMFKLFFEVLLNFFGILGSGKPPFTASAMLTTPIPMKIPIFIAAEIADTGDG